MQTYIHTPIFKTYAYFSEFICCTLFFFPASEEYTRAVAKVHTFLQGGFVPRKQNLQFRRILVYLLSLLIQISGYESTNKQISCDFCKKIGNNTHLYTLLIRVLVSDSDIYRCQM